MKIKFNTKVEEIKSGSLVKFDDKYYGIYLTDMDGENPVLYDLEEDVYYTDVDMHDIQAVNGDVKLVIE